MVKDYKEHPAVYDAPHPVRRTELKERPEGDVWSVEKHPRPYELKYVGSTAFRIVYDYYVDESGAAWYKSTHTILPVTELPSS